MTITIIEDEKPSARRLQRMLDSLGYQVTNMLHSVEESVQWFQDNDHPDLIFLDIESESFSGTKRPEIPCFIISGIPL